MLYFCTFLWLVDLRICFCLERARPWSEFKINFNQYRYLSRKHWWDLITIHFVFIQFSCVPMSKVSTPPASWDRCLGGRIFCCSRGNYIFFFQFPFWYILEKYKFGLCTTAWITGFRFWLSFYLWKRVRLTWDSLSLHFHIVLELLVSY